ncbi:rod shape-determining protein MreC [Agaribacterium sp. ZY112]|uniref:rod shape-determining protein MreC n=1 Tax=Agaribacterium sp. ZY112 TaxID=3233574 RepID=UPI003523F0AD
MFIYAPLFSSARSIAVDISVPFHWLSDLPERTGLWADDRLSSRAALIHENQALRSENLILNQKLQKNAALEAENFRLRQLLNASDAVQTRVLIGEIVGVAPDPQVHKVLINRGSNNGVYEGQAVLDAFGLMGQVVEVGEQQSVALLITDATHALPVQVNRNGVRLVADGVGTLESLILRHVANTVDIQVGDLLVSSGLGLVFPAGYPVAEVTEVEVDPGRAFARVKAAPKAQMNRSRHVLLVFEDKKGG